MTLTDTLPTAAPHKFGVHHMDPYVKSIWVYELRSGKYEQTTDALRIGNSFCVLGVLCDMFAKATGRARWVHPPEGGSAIFVADDQTDCGEPPRVVCEWAGWLDTEDHGWVDYNPVVAGKPLSIWNDADGLPFAELADLIEANL